MNLKKENQIKHIAIEGFDGVGKTTLCNLLSKDLNLRFIEKPFKNFFNSNQEEKYIELRNNFNNINNELSIWFYNISYASVYSHKENINKNIITDRFYASNYAWSKITKNFNGIKNFKEAIKKFGNPDLTIILYASNDVILKRLNERDKNDSDKQKIMSASLFYEEVKKFLKKTKQKYMLIDTDNKSEIDIKNEVENICKKILKI